MAFGGIPRNNFILDPELAVRFKEGGIPQDPEKNVEEDDGDTERLFQRWRRLSVGELTPSAPRRAGSEPRSSSKRQPEATEDPVWSGDHRETSEENRRGRTMVTGDEEGARQRQRPVARRQQSGMCSLSDVTAVVKPFSGTNKQNALKWLHSFLSYADFKQIYGFHRIQLFKLLMTDSAADWIFTLSPNMFNSEEILYEAFQKRFGYTEAMKITAESQLWHRVQKPNETVDDYVTAMRIEAHQLQMPEQQLFKIITNGFKEPIKMFVMNNHCQSIDEALNVARTCEAAHETDRPNSQEVAIGKLTEMVQNLRTELAQAATQKAERDNCIAPLQDFNAHNDAGLFTNSNAGQTFTNQYRTSPHKQQSYQYQIRHNFYPPQDASFGENRPQFRSQRQFSQQQQPRVRWQQNSGHDSASPYPAHTHIPPSYQQSHRTGRCTRYCGRVHILGREHCMAKNMICESCGKQGHLRAVCRSKSMTQQAINTQQ